MNRLGNFGGSSSNHDEEEGGEVLTPTPSRRTTVAKDELAPTAAKRMSGVIAGRRISSGPGTGMGEMGPPERKAAPTRKLSDLGETY